MKFTAAASAAALAGLAAASNPSRRFGILQFNGKEIFKGRVDPIVNPGETARHVHGVVGSSGFGPNADGKSLSESKCTNAKVKEDLSSYWFPWLYFQDPSTEKFEPVDIHYVNVYYFFDATDDDIKAFPQGLEIVGGNASMYTAPDTNGRINLNPSQGPIQPVQWTCPRSSDGAAWPSDSDGSKAGQADPNNAQSGTGFPDVDCDGFASPLRADIHMPSCYNPDKGLTAHTENMVYPNDEGGKYNCPQGYTHVPHMFYEIYWDTPAFKSRWTQGQGSQPFVLSTGDVAGYSSHADFMSAWDEDTLQKIIDNCDAQHAGLHTCADATENNDSQCECENESPVDEVVNGILDVLPGNKHLQGWSLPILGSGDSADDDSSSGPVGDVVDAILPGGSDEESSAEPQPSSTIAPLDINHHAQADEGAPTPAPVFSSEAAPEPEIQTSFTEPRVKTVWETEIVTATHTELLERADPTPEGAERKRRHVHNHAARHRSNRF